MSLQIWHRLPLTSESKIIEICSTMYAFSKNMSNTVFYVAFNKKGEGRSTVVTVAYYWF